MRIFKKRLAIPTTCRHSDTLLSDSAKSEKPLVVENDVVIKTPLIIFEKSWQSGEVSGDWRKDNITSIFKKDKKDEEGHKNDPKDGTCLL